MKLSRCPAAVALTVALASCASPRSRINKNRSAFDAYPPAVQKTIRTGQVDIGFTREQVVMALGPSDRRYTRKTAAATQDVWGYGIGSSGADLDAGFGLGSPEGGYGGGSDESIFPKSNRRKESRLRVVFQNDAVVGVEGRY
jgi:hypothetical protein